MRILPVLAALGGMAMASGAQALDCQPYRYRNVDGSDVTTAGAAPSFFLEVRYRQAPPSYLLGTFHSAAPAVLARWDRTLLVAAASSVRTIIVERRDEGPVADADPRLLDDHEHLRRLLAGEEGLYGAAVELLASYGLPHEQIDRFQPWYVSALLQQAPAMRFPGNNEILDVYLVREAERLGFPIRALETLADVAAYYERGLSDADQIRLLWEAVCNGSLNEQSIAGQTAAYVADDVDRMYRELERLQGSDSGLAEKLTDTFVRERNQQFWQLIQPELMAGGAFVAIGNLHLFGEGGLWHRLAAAAEEGFVVRAVLLEEMSFTLEPADVGPALEWVGEWARRNLAEADAGTDFEGLKVRPRSITELREELCPGRRCDIDATYVIDERTIYATTSLFAQLMQSADTPRFYLEGPVVRKGEQGQGRSVDQAIVYAESILIRELARHLLYMTQYPEVGSSEGPGLSPGGLAMAEPDTAACIRNRVLHRASLAQQEYLRWKESSRTARIFPLNATCAVPGD